MFARQIALFAVAFVISVPRAHAQTRGSVAVLAGTSTDVRGIRSNAITVAPGAIVTLASRSAAFFGANATRFENNAWAAGAGVALIARTQPAHGFAFALTGNGNATTTSFNTNFVTGDATPAIEANVRRLTLSAGMHAAIGRTAVSESRSFGGVPVGVAFTSVTRATVQPVFGAELRVMQSPRYAATLWAREDPMRIDGVRVSDHSAGIRATGRRVSLAGTVGVRDAIDEHTSFGSATMSVGVARFASLDIAAGSYPANRLTGTARGRYVTAGLGFRFGSGFRDPASTEAMPRPAGAKHPAKGYTRVAISEPRATTVELAGDWNHWQPVAATRSDNGVWYADILLAPGEYRYSFRVDGKDWRVARGTAVVDDGFGGKSAYITVR